MSESEESDQVSIEGRKRLLEALLSNQASLNATFSDEDQDSVKTSIDIIVQQLTGHQSSPENHEQLRTCITELIFQLTKALAVNQTVRNVRIDREMNALLQNLRNVETKTDTVETRQRRLHDSTQTLATGAAVSTMVSVAILARVRSVRAALPLLPIPLLLFGITLKLSGIMESNSDTPS